MATADHSTINSTPAPPKVWADTPEAILASLPGEYFGTPLSLLSCVLARAEAVVALLSSELEDDNRDQREEYLVHALWDVLGNLEIARTLLKRWDVARPI